MFVVKETHDTAEIPETTITTITMARRPRGVVASDLASNPAPPAASAVPHMSEDVKAQFQSYIHAAHKATDEARAKKPSTTGWKSPKSSPKGKRVVNVIPAPQTYGAEQWLALPAGVRLADAFEGLKDIPDPAPKPAAEKQDSKPIAAAESTERSAESQPAGPPPAIVTSGAIQGPAPVAVPVTPAPVPVAEPKAPPPRAARLILTPRSIKVAKPVFYLPVAMEDVVFHPDPKVEWRDFDGDVVMQDPPQVPVPAPKELDAALRKLRLKHQKHKSKILARVTRMAGEKIRVSKSRK
ncbi:hypothetical protein TWF730_009122 [Orbilia blumenaviensis]|uniref:Uncharacterized protein n=1 Tax=Orbilia blumenaviensis TaxID=1796055 RepID=A0AAV9V052_9PEZI